MLSTLRPWQAIAAIGAAIIAVVMGAAAVAYNASLGDGTQLLTLGPITITSRQVFGAMALALDLLMVVSIFGLVHWSRNGNRLAALLCGLIFAISSAISVHSARGFIAVNVVRATAPDARAHDLYSSLKGDLTSKQRELDYLRAMVGTVAVRDRNSLDHSIRVAEAKVNSLRAEMGRANIGHTVSPLAGIEWALAIILWLVNATCWYAFFGGHGNTRTQARDNKNNEKSGGSDSDDTGGQASNIGGLSDDTVINLADIRRLRTSIDPSDDGHVATFISTLARDQYTWSEIRGLYAMYCKTNNRRALKPRHLARRFMGERWSKSGGTWQRRTLSASIA